MTDRDEYERDLAELHKAAIDAAIASQSRPLTENEIMTWAWCAGIANDVYKELRHETV